jgi:hypothetical protein
MSPISKSGHLSEEEKTERIQKVETHLSIAKAERDLYNREIRLNKESLDIIGSIEDSHHRADEIHVSYVFAHQLHCLNNTQQPGLAYFLSMRKCQLFGVTCEAMGQQVNYLIDEADLVDKGANTTISLGHHSPPLLRDEFSEVSLTYHDRLRACNS